MMITQQQAEDLAQKAMQEYVNKCGCNTTEDVSNVLMKLACMCGLAMCAVGGKADAVARLQGTADYISKTQEGVNWKSQALTPTNKH